MEDRLWSMKDIANYLSVAHRVAMVYVKGPTFPKPIYLPNGRGGTSHPRWKATEVVQWVESYQ